VKVENGERIELNVFGVLHKEHNGFLVVHDHDALFSYLTLRHLLSLCDNALSRDAPACRQRCS
jgi:hypothetical protein